MLVPNRCCTCWRDARWQQTGSAELNTGRWSNLSRSDEPRAGPRLTPDNKRETTAGWKARRTEEASCLPSRLALVSTAHPSAGFNSSSWATSSIYAHISGEVGGWVGAESEMMTGLWWREMRDDGRKEARKTWWGEVKRHVCEGFQKNGELGVNEDVKYRMGALLPQFWHVKGSFMDGWGGKEDQREGRKKGRWREHLSWQVHVQSMGEDRVGGGDWDVQLLAGKFLPWQRGDF